MTPREWLLKLLCEIYKIYGGDCKDFDNVPAQAVALVKAEYDKDGAPSFPNAQAKADFLNILADLEALITGPDNPLDAGDTATLLQLIADIRKDLA